MKKLCFMLLILFYGGTLSPLSAQTFADFLDRVNNAQTGSEKNAIVDSFMAAAPSFPHVEFDTLTHFIYRGNASSIGVPGDHTGWDPNGLRMNLLGGTNFWYATAAYEDDARLDYKFVLNGNNWILDPRNPFTVEGGFGPNSELRMPMYVAPPEIEFYPNIPHGSFEDTVYNSINMGNSRLVRVYLPPGYTSSSDSFPMILFHDGLEYISLARANRVFDYLISENQIEPLIAVFVPPVNRTSEYSGNLRGAFTQFIVDEIMPWVEGDYRIKAGAENHAVMGASNGGNISLWQGLSHPGVFGNVGAQSSNIQADIHDGFLNGPFLDLNIYMDLGTYDIPVLIPLVRNFIPVLQSRGYNYLYAEYHEGHSWGFWRAHIDDAVKFFFPASTTGISGTSPQPTTPLLLRNYPNPFNPVTTIEFQLEKRANTAIRIFNMLGQQVSLLNFQDTLAPGMHTIQWDGKDSDGVSQPSGIYLYQLRVDGKTRATRMMHLVK